MRAISSRWAAFLDGVTPADRAHLSALSLSAMQLPIDEEMRNSQSGAFIVDMVSAVLAELHAQTVYRTAPVPLSGRNPRPVTAQWDRFMRSINECSPERDFQRGVYLEQLVSTALIHGRTLFSLFVLRLISAIHADYETQRAYDATIGAEVDAQFPHVGAFGDVQVTIAPGRTHPVA